MKTLIGIVALSNLGMVLSQSNMFNDVKEAYTVGEEYTITYSSLSGYLMNIWVDPDGDTICMSDFQLLHWYIINHLV